MYEYAGMLLSGEGSDGATDEDKAKRLYLMAADHGHVQAALKAALCLANGVGGELNTRKALGLLHAAADSEAGPSIEAKLNLGMLYVKGMGIVRNASEGLRYLMEAAEAGDARACLELGEMRLFGTEGVQTDAKEAVSLLTDACDAGAGGEAMWLLGRWA